MTTEDMLAVVLIASETFDVPWFEILHGRDAPAVRARHASAWLGQYGLGLRVDQVAAALGLGADAIRYAVAKLEYTRRRESLFNQALHVALRRAEGVRRAGMSAAPLAG
ncbi:MAG TPA: hypothetical protein VMU93_16780 [Caulobacteraceae bacterium]|nr:hypothetical protein [Caulobacteraceae bacterium]